MIPRTPIGSWLHSIVVPVGNHRGGELACRKIEIKELTGKGVAGNDVRQDRFVPLLNDNDKSRGNTDSDKSRLAPEAIRKGMQWKGIKAWTVAVPAHR